MVKLVDVVSRKFSENINLAREQSLGNNTINSAPGRFHQQVPISKASEYNKPKRALNFSISYNLAIPMRCTK